MGYVSRKSFTQRWRGDRESVREQIELFLEHAPSQIQELSEALQVEHAGSLLASAVMLKNLSQPLRVKALTQAIARLESDGERGDIPGAREEFSELRNCFEEVYGELLELLQDLEHDLNAEEAVS